MKVWLEIVTVVGIGYMCKFLYIILKTLRSLHIRGGIEPGPMAVKALSPNDWTAREFQRIYIFFYKISFLFF